MEEQLISFDTAKLAKEKKFNIPCENFYIEYIDDDVADLFNYEEQRGSGYAELYRNNQEFKYSAPTQSLLQKWLREVHKIIVTSKPYQDDVSNETDEDIEFQTLWENEIVNVKDSYNTFSDNTFHHSYEEALEIGLYQALKLIK